VFSLKIDYSKSLASMDVVDSGLSFTVSTVFDKGATLK
jgi:hypothetical protein